MLAAGLAALPHVTTIGQVMAWATAMGLGGGLVMVLFFSVWPRVYGRAHLGRIQGAAQAMTVLASAIGPLLLAACIEWTGSYAGMFNILAGVIGLAAFSAMITPLPAADPGPPIPDPLIHPLDTPVEAADSLHWYGLVNASNSCRARST